MPDEDSDDAGDDEFPDADSENPRGERSPSEAGPGETDSDVLRDARAGESGGDAPLSGLREDIERRRDADSDDDFEELFTEVAVGGVDEAAVWEELSEGEVAPPVDTGVDDDTGGDAGEPRDVTVVEKRLCHDCPHFADPPETACTHEGTTIDAEVDVDHFRVVDCPVVAARRDVRASDFSADDP